MSLWFIFVVLGAYVVWRPRGEAAAGRALALGLFLTGIDHLLTADWYVSVMADWIPQKRAVVLASAAARIGLAVALWPAASRRGALWGVLALLLAVLPVNLRIAVAPAAIAPVADWPAWQRWLRLALHAGWIGWTALALCRRDEPRNKPRNKASQLEGISP